MTADLTYSAYARHRKAAGLTGQTHRAVRRAVDVGLIPAHDGRIDADEADAAWARNVDVHQQARGKKGRRPKKNCPSTATIAGNGLADDQRRLIREQAAKIALQNAVARREVAPIALLTECAARAAKRVAAILDGIPGAIKRRVPHVDELVLAIVREEIAKGRNAAAEVDLTFDDMIDDPDAA